MQSFRFSVYRNNFLVGHKEIPAENEAEAEFIMKTECDERNFGTKRFGRVVWQHKIDKPNNLGK